MNTDEQQKLSDESQKFVKQMIARYSENLIKSMHRGEKEYCVAVLSGLQRAGITGDEMASVRAWLIGGLRPFAQYPPTIEALVQMAFLIRDYPRTEFDERNHEAWRQLYVSFSQKYGKNWKADNPFDPLEKERVWLSALAEHNPSPSEMREVVKRIREGGAFRNYPPNVDQFIDALMAYRLNDSPMVEDAWLMALTSEQTDVHPLVRKVKGLVGAYDIRVSGRDRDIEQRFKSIYRKFLHEGYLIDNDDVKAAIPENESMDLEDIDEVKRHLCF